MKLKPTILLPWRRRFLLGGLGALVAPQLIVPKWARSAAIMANGPASFPAAGGGGVAPTLVQSTSKLNNGGNNTIDLAYSGNVTNGNLLVVALWGFLASAHGPLTAGMCTQLSGTATTATVTLDEKADRTDGANSNLVGLWSVPVTGGGSCTMRVQITGGSFLCLAVAEVSGVDVSGTRVNATATTAAGTNVNIASGNVATGGAGIIFGVCSPGNPYGTITLTEDGAFTKIAEQEDDSQHNGSLIYRTVSTNTTDSADWTAGTSCSWEAIAVAYKSSTP